MVELENDEINNGNEINSNFNSSNVKYIDEIHQEVDKKIQQQEDIENYDKKDKWNSKLQFLLTCIGFAVGLGNIWRFPALAYDNGGVAFLIPYVILSLIVGFPILYMELVIGQSTSQGALKVFGQMVPIFQGVGWGMISVSIFLISFYGPLISWVLIYIVKIVLGNFETIVSCKNEWNTIYCTSTIDDNLCLNNSIYFNKTCQQVPENIDVITFRKELYQNNSLINASITYAAEEFFYKQLLTLSTNFWDQTFIPNWEIFLSYTVVYLLVAIIVIKGVKIMGRVSFITSTVPYLIMLFFFIYSFQLEGSKDGVRFLLYDKTDFAKILSFKPWLFAGEQLFLSLSCGIGVTLSLSSYNEKDHNIYRDSLIVVFADSFMSVFGGLTTFSILGFMANRLGKKIDDVVSTGKVLAFVVYPEVAALTPIPVLFSLLFFIMLLFLGISSIVCSISGVATSITDKFERLKKHKYIVLLLSIFIMYLFGLPLTTKSGIYYFEILNSTAVSFNALFIGAMECITITHFYGIKNFKNDIRRMLGYQKDNMISKIFGSSGYMFHYCLMYIIPIVLFFLSIFGIIESMKHNYLYGDDQYQIKLPNILIYFGWFVSYFPLSLILFGVAYEVWNRRNSSNFLEMIKPNEKHINDMGFYEESYIVKLLETCCWWRKKNGNISVFKDNIVSDLSK
uniref:Transporter n=1 Tax=Parastrongyloides trichosuri TaxID=131310 RepID=A0A0N4ZKT7_PARTI